MAREFGSRSQRHKNRRAAWRLVVSGAAFLVALSALAAPSPEVMRRDAISPGLGAVPPEVLRGDPREAMAGFLDACQQGRFDLAAFYLDLGGIPPQRQREEGARLARRLLLTLQRTVWVDPEKLSNEPLGSLEAGMPANEQRFATIEIHHHRTELFLVDRWDAELGHVWTISRETVALIDRLYGSHGYGWVGDHAPVFLFAATFAGLQLWQWLALLVGLVAGWVVSRLLGRCTLAALRRVAARTALGWDDIAAQALDGPAGFLLWAVLLALAAPWLGLTPDAQRMAHDLCKLLALVGLGWFLLRLADATAAHLREGAGAANQVGVGFLPMFTRFAKVLAVTLVALAALDVIGLNVLAFLTGLGLAGVAVAFAAQKTLENVFGTAAIASDRPFEVGDFVAIGQDTGTVEDVGFRSTRLRTLSRTLVTIPNGVVVAGRVENFSERDRILYNPTIGLAYGTAVAQLTYVVDEIKRLLVAHPRVFQGEHRVRFKAFGESALQIELFCWIATRDWNEYTGIVEEINLGIAAIVEFAGCQFALPGRALYVPREGAVDPERLRAITEEVKRRRERGELGVAGASKGATASGRPPEAEASRP